MAINSIQPLRVMLSPRSNFEHVLFKYNTLWVDWLHFIDVESSSGYLMLRGKGRLEAGVRCCNLNGSLKVVWTVVSASDFAQASFAWESANGQMQPTGWKRPIKYRFL